jgi:hypothetical protein
MNLFGHFAIALSDFLLKSEATKRVIQKIFTLKYATFPHFIQS